MLILTGLGAQSAPLCWFLLNNFGFPYVFFSIKKMPASATKGPLLFFSYLAYLAYLNHFCGFERGGHYVAAPASWLSKSQV